MRLPNHNHLIQAFPDAMHTIKNSIERVFLILIGKTNLDKILAAELASGRFGFSMTGRKRKRGEGSTVRVYHPYMLSADELKIADARSKAIIMNSKDFNPGAIFFRTTGMKSHDWKEVYLWHICYPVHIHMYHHYIVSYIACFKKYLEILCMWNATEPATENTI